MIGLIFAIIVFVCGMIVTIWSASLTKEEGKKDKSIKCGSRIFVVFGMLASLCISAIVFGIVDFAVFMFTEYDYIETEYYEEIISTENITALQDTKATEGSFFVGTIAGTGGGFGSTSEYEYYILYVEKESGYQRIKLDAYDKNLFIEYIEDDETPHIDYYSNKKRKYLEEKPDKTSFFLYNKYKDYKEGDSLGTWTSNYVNKTVICVPEGTILENYNIDMQ